MTVDSTSSSQRDRAATGVRQPGIARATSAMLWLLAVALFARSSASRRS